MQTTGKRLLKKHLMQRIMKRRRKHEVRQEGPFTFSFICPPFPAIDGEGICEFIMRKQKEKEEAEAKIRMN